MNMNSNPTIDQLQQIFTACNDKAGHHVLWIERNGEVHLDQLPEALGPVGFEESKFEMQCRFETYSQGAGYVGAEAAKDKDFIESVYDELVRVWPRVKGQSDIEYVDH